MLTTIARAICLISLSFIGTILEANGQSRRRPNFVFIIADDLSPTLGCYGDAVVPTPAIDQLAKEGTLFINAFSVAPSCTASRAAILTSRYPHELKEGANLWGTLPVRFDNMVNILEKHSYRVGLTGKGWGPGDPKAGGYDRNPAGPAYGSFQKFIASTNTDEPFFLWVGSSDPHRPYDEVLKNEFLLKKENLIIPPYWPDSAKVREDLLDYYAEVARFDKLVAGVVEELKSSGRWSNTIVIVTSDNGMPFPRAKANVYDGGARIPLIIAGGGFKKTVSVRPSVSLIDIAPTVLTLAGLSPSDSMRGKSLQRFADNLNHPDSRVFIERERHASVREGNLSYPMRAVRSSQYLYISNPEPDRWPAGDSTARYHMPVFGDIDHGLAKEVMLKNINNPTFADMVQWSFFKRPAEELYDLQKDPWQLHNVANEPGYQKVLTENRKALRDWQEKTGDPRVRGNGRAFDLYPYYGFPK